MEAEMAENCQVKSNCKTGYTRDKLNKIARSCGLNASDYKNKDELCKAIVNTMRKSGESPVKVHRGRPAKRVTAKKKVANVPVETEIEFIFNGAKQVLQVLENGGLLVDLLGRPDNTICPLIGTEIASLKILGVGTVGKAYLVKSNLNGEKIFVMKKSELNINKEKIPKDVTLKKLARILNQEYQIPTEITEWVNNYKIPSTGIAIIPSYAVPCRTGEVIVEERFDNEGPVVVPVGSYLCGSEMFSEFAISSMCGQLYSRGISANFIEMYNFAICQPVNPSSFTFMELTNGEIKTSMFTDKSVKNSLFAETGFVIQVLHAIATYQKHYAISHNDLHLGNVFYSEIGPETMFNGQTLYDADYFHYSVRSGKSGKVVNLYLPATPYLAKIGDFGKAFKWSPPMVGELYLIENGYNSSGAPWMPNWYIPQYDSSYFLNCMSRNNSVEVDEIFSMLEIPHQLFRPNGRPIFSEPDDQADYTYYPDITLQNFPQLSALSLLTNKDIFRNFMEVPKRGKIVTLGEI